MCGVGFVADLRGRSRRVLPVALRALVSLAHRGAIDADGVTGDGAGVLIEIPRELLALRDEAVGMIFGAREPFEQALRRHGLAVTGWRSVPVDPGALGPKARATMPMISQAFVARPAGITDSEFERLLVRARKECGEGDLYVVSLSDRTVVYKALVGAAGLAAFYPDLRSPQLATSIAVFHQRFSTNTLPSWPMTQPFRLLGHNGEINTIAGNRNSMRARGFPLTPGTSDSASLDEALAIVCESENIGTAMSELLASWEGPAMIAFSDGRLAGAALDRNGLRPARYSITADGLVVVASETGVVELDRVVAKGRLSPGGMLVVDLERGTVSRQQAKRLSSVVGRLSAPNGTTNDQPPTTNVLKAFGYTQDEIDLVLRPMFEHGAEPIGSMGDDTPLAVLSSRPQLLFSFFKQRFAQVTNPPIDPLREAVAMDIGEPLLDEPEGEVVSLLFEQDLQKALEEMIERAVRCPAATIVLSDRGVDERHAAIPSLLAVSAVHQRLVERGLRIGKTIIADAGDARDDHQIAALLAFGADAVCPWLALQLAGQDRERYRTAIHKGLRKILSKMGVSTMRAYRGAQLFEAIGIAEGVIDRYFSGTLSSIGGIALDGIERSVMARHRAAFVAAPAQLEDAGLFRYRQRGELHAYNPSVVKSLHAAIRSGRALDYQSYAKIVHAREPVNLRDLWEFRLPTPEPRALSPESPSHIVRRFMTSAMSLGALSPEAQRVIAEGMNRLGARSNSGEGGEPPEIYATPAGNRIKQVASGRFGVTADYLVHADELQIKIAQGSKPGEGGQLPGHKVTPFIARIRHATPGMTLISPPPHHDIYSIEDLAQLIYDLKRVNPAATVSVKLVSSAGIGTIAVGVAKAYADAIEISGHDGGTGASPLGSIKNAGTPWEIGLSEVQQALIEAGLRDRVRLQVNGGIKTGRDVVIAALLGADEFGFGTAALVATGCVMARQCHLNTCPVGIATQREDLRSKFKATPDDVVRFFTAVAEEVREIVELLGFETVDEIIGRTDLLFVARESLLSFDRILAPPPAGPSRWMQRRNDPPVTGSRLDEAILQRHVIPSVSEESGRAGVRDRSDRPPRFLATLGMTYGITNSDRSVGARIAGELARRSSSEPLHLAFRGTAGQSFGAFCVDGMHLALDGDANDYVGKSMSGGEIVIRGDAGNTVLYGATGGRAFIAGRAGERFAVRNSGAIAVVEGAGDHTCEYMTGGAVVILGATGRNIGAGMTGGIVFLLDLDPSLINGDVFEAPASTPALDWLYDVIAAHLAITGSSTAATLLDGWSSHQSRFTRLAPVGTQALQRLPEIGLVSQRKRRSG